MSDVTTNGPLRVVPNERGGPYVRVLLDRLPVVLRLLEARGVFHWVDRSPVRLPGRPAVTYINFGHQGQARVGELQALLDELG